MLRLLPLALLLALAACTAPPAGHEPLVSTMSPPAAQASKAEPQPLNSLPPGSLGFPQKGPNATVPDFASTSFPLF